MDYSIAAPSPGRSTPQSESASVFLVRHDDVLLAIVLAAVLPSLVLLWSLRIAARQAEALRLMARGTAIRQARRMAAERDARAVRTARAAETKRPVVGFRVSVDTEERQPL
jgi:hypothetical protein